MFKFLAIPAIAFVIPLAGYGAPVADATPMLDIEDDICALFTLKPTYAGFIDVMEAGEAGVGQGNYTRKEFAETVYEAVTTLCPENLNVLLNGMQTYKQLHPQRGFQQGMLV